MPKCINCGNEDASKLIKAGKDSILDKYYVCSDKCEAEANRYFKMSKLKFGIQIVSVLLLCVPLTLENDKFTPLYIALLGLVMLLLPYAKHGVRGNIRHTKKVIRTIGVFVLIASLLIFVINIIHK